MIKLQDFAREQGVTDRQIQRLLKKYASELEGLYERRGHNGTWLSEDACVFLRAKMKQAPIVVSETSDVVKNLEEENKRLRDALLTAKDTIIELKDANHVLEIENKDTKLLEAQNGDLRAERDNERKDRLAAEKTAQAANAESWRLYREALEIYNDLPWWKKRRRNAPVPPSEKE